MGRMLHAGEHGMSSTEPRFRASHHDHDAPDYGMMWAYGVVMMRPEWSEMRLIDELELVSEEGWELVAVIYNPVLNAVVMYFKRPFSHPDHQE